MTPHDLARGMKGRELQTRLLLQRARVAILEVAKAILALAIGYNVCTCLVLLCAAGVAQAIPQRLSGVIHSEIGQFALAVTMVAPLAVAVGLLGLGYLYRPATVWAVAAVAMLTATSVAWTLGYAALALATAKAASPLSSDAADAGMAQLAASAFWLALPFAVPAALMGRRLKTRPRSCCSAVSPGTSASGGKGR